MAHVIIGHTGKKYHVVVNAAGVDYVILIFDNKKEYKEVFASFHRKGDLNEINGKYYHRHEPESKRYEIFLEYDGYYILEVMEINDMWSTLKKPGDELSINIGFLNGDLRTEQEYKNRIRASVIDNLLINSK